MSDEVWWDDVVRWIVQGALWGFALFVASWTLIAYGEARMSAVALQAFQDREWCMSIIRPTLEVAERAAYEVDRASLEMDVYLERPTVLPELVAEASVE